ncbi:MCE family protein [Sinimarinibacterium sp. CAU 1509]|uniref:PqiB family protein n=1 Tax=Sinimarinibacterium sp. CAU 1509 TaxID=2562283 RepID=UPI0010AD2A05|nr:MlaD family protein [Sinimarinibacterium sp. CAU 1509]TJY61911.1 MCE family protein [Sinimarinibacterium sp. CAU 1509]
MSTSDVGFELPQPDIRPPRKYRPSLVWLVPLVAAAIGLVLVVRAALSAGTMIEITFESAEGLEAGVTEVKFKDVVVGHVKAISLSDDLQRVVVEVVLARSAERLAVDDTRFWVVRPRVDTGGISGLSTLVSGVYISLDVGQSTEARSEFVGLETAPAVTSDQQGTAYVLHSDGLGSIDVGSPIYYRRIPVGRVGSYTLDPDGRGVTLQVFISAPYNRFVTESARFWNASGIDLSLGASGLTVNTESLASVLAGGVAFQNFGDAAAVAAAQTEFQLYDSLTAAMSPPTNDPLDIRMRFVESMRGLSVGAPIDFRGVELGTVKSVDLEYDAERKQFLGNVVARVFPSRLGRAYDALSEQAGAGERVADRVFARLVAEGLRAQLRTGNLISGQLYVALDFIPKAKPAGVVIGVGPLEIPTERGSLEQIQTQIADIISKFNKVPFEEIGRSLRDTLRGADALLRQLDGDVAPEARKTLVEAQRALGSVGDALDRDSGVQNDLSATLGELERAGRSLRSLADYLQRHPESLLRGKVVDDEPTLTEPEH